MVEPTIASTVSASVATKVAQKAVEGLFALGRGQVAFWWKEQKNKKEIARKLGERIRRIDKIKTLLHNDREVQLSKIFYPSRIIYDDAPPKRVDSIAHLPASQNYIIEGTVGQGKSVFLRYLCFRHLREQSEQIPLFLELRYVDPQHSFQQFLFDGIAALGLHVNEEFFDFYARSGRFVLLLDAFDELPQQCVTQVVSALENLTSRYPQLQIIVTSRPNSPLHPSTSFKTIKLAPIPKGEHQKFLERLLGDAARAKRIALDIQQSPHHVQQLLSTPLLLTLLAVIYNADQAVPQNEAEFYRRLFDVLLYRHDSTKLGFRRRRYTTLGEQDIRQLFEAFCFFTRQARLGVLTIDQFSECLNKAMANTGLKVDHFKYKDEVVKVACLLQEEGFSLHFIHKSVQEFYASAFILNSPEPVAIKFYQAMSEARWQAWRQEIRFLSITDTYRFNRYFLRPQMQELCRQLDITVHDGLKLEMGQNTCARTLDCLLGTFAFPKKATFKTSNEMRQWKPLVSVRHEDVVSSDERSSDKSFRWFGEDSLYSAELLERHFLIGLFAMINEASDKMPLIDLLSSAGSARQTHGDTVQVSLAISKAVSILRLEGEVTQSLEKGIAALATKWQEAESLVQVYDGRVDII